MQKLRSPKNVGDMFMAYERKAWGGGLGVSLNRWYLSLDR